MKYIFALLLSFIFMIEQGECTNAREGGKFVDDPKQTVSLLDLDSMNSPMSFTIITEADIRNSGARNLTELLEMYVPGFQYLFNPFYGTLWGMRGISNDRNTKFIVMVNNHKLNMLSRDGFKSELVLGMLGDITRIEVLRGPASFMYGSGAMAGIINIITRNGDRDTAFASVFTENIHSRETDLFFVRHINQQNVVRLSLGGKNSPGMRNGASRLYGIPTWPFPGPFDTYDNGFHIADWDTDGVPSDGKYGATNGNLKFSANWEYAIDTLQKLVTYLRFTRQEESAGGWFIVDPWKEYTGSPVAPSSLADDNSTLSFLPGISSRFVDGKEIAPDDSFWTSTESYGDNRRRYVNENLMAFTKYTRTLSAQRNKPTHEFNLSLGFDKVSNTTVLERRDNYPDLRRAPDNLLETFGEWRLTGSGVYLFKQGGKKERKKSDLQCALGIEGELDGIGKDWLGRNQWSGQPDHKVVSEETYGTISLFGEGFLSMQQQNNKPRCNINGGIRFDLSPHPEFNYAIDDGTKKSIPEKWIPMLNSKLAIGLLPVPSQIKQMNLEQSYRLIFQTSSNNGSADNYLPNRYHYNDGGTINSKAVFEDTIKVINAYQPIIRPFEVDDVDSLSPEHIWTLEFLMTTLLYANENIFNLTFSAAYGSVSNLFAWSQSNFRVKNAGYYSYLNVDGDFHWDGEKASAGINTTWQRPLPNPRWHDEDSALTEKLYRDIIIDNTPKNDSAFKSAITDTLDIVKDAITADHTHFLNLSHIVTKLFFTFRPIDWLSCHSDCRIFWGFTGRKYIKDRDIRVRIKRDTVITKQGTNDSIKAIVITDTFVKDTTISNTFNTLDMDDFWPPIVKLDVSLHFHLRPDMTLSLFAYNILGIENSSFSIPWKKFLQRNTLRPLFIADPKTNGYVSTDQLSLAAKLSVSF